MKRLLASLAIAASAAFGFDQTAAASIVGLAQTGLGPNGVDYTVREDAGSVVVTVNVTRDANQPNEVIQVDYSTSDGTAVASGDYAASSGTLTFTAGVTAQTVSIPIAFQDDADDADPNNASGSESFSFQIKNPRSNGGAQPTISGPDTATITIIDVDGNRVGFTSPDYQVNEPAVGGARTVRLIVKRDGDNSQGASVNYQTSDGSAKAGRDYFAQNGTLAFPNNSPDKTGEDAGTQFIDLTVLNDEAAEGNKAFTVTLTATNPGGSRLGTSKATVTIVDADTSTVQFSSAAYQVSETSPKATITLVRTGNLNQSGVVNVATVPGTAQPDRNYITTNASITFAPGESTKTFEIPLINDNVVTGTLYFDVGLSAASGSPLLVGGITSARVSITDAAPSNTVEFIQSEFSIAQDGVAAKITVRLNRAPGSNDTVSVNYSTSTFTGSGEAAAANIDYTPVSGRLTFAPGETIKFFQVPVIDNGQIANTKKVALNLDTPTSNAFLGIASATLNIVNVHSAGTIQFSAAQYSVLENNGAVTLTVLLDRTGDTNRTVTVDYATSPGSAGTNRFVPTSGRLTFAPGAAVATISVGIINDSFIEPPQSFTVSLSNPQNAVLGATSVANVIIQDDDGLNFVEFDAADYGAVEKDGVVQIRVRAVRGGDPNQVLTVQLSLGGPGDTATNPNDYQDPPSTTVTFPAGISVQVVAIPITNDPAPQSSRFFTIGLTNPGQFTQVGRQGTARVTIFDNSGPNTVQLLTTMNRFREGDQQAIAITVVRFGAFDRNGTRVNFTTELRAGDTAQDGVNFTQTTGQITFAPQVQSQNGQNVVVGNETLKSIIIPIPNNTLVQGDVTFHVTLTSSDVAQLGSISSTQVTITDDDLGNVVQFAAATYTVAEAGGNAILTVKLTPNGDASKASSVNYAATPISAFAGFDFSPVSGTLTFAPGETTKTILVPINNDDIPEDPETFRVTLSSPSSGTIIGPQSSAIVTIIDDDAANVKPTFQFNSSVLTTSNALGTASVTVTLSRGSNANGTFSVDFATSDISALAGTDYIANTGTLTFGPGEVSKVIPVTLIPQQVGAPTRQFKITLSNPSAGALLGDIAEIVISIINPDLATKLTNVSTRGPVEQGNDVMIAGVIVRGSSTKQVIVRGLGPSLTQFGVIGAISDPTLTLYDANGQQLAFNDNFGTNSAAALATLKTNNLTPTDSREAAIVTTLGTGSYTAILRAKSNGIGLVETYDTSATAASALANISTRGKIEQGDDGAMIAGFIVAPPPDQQGTAVRVAIRALGPSLKSAGLSNAIADTTLDLYRGSEKILSNDNWKTNSSADQQELKDNNLAPTNDKEAALVTTLDPGTYTAVIRGKNNVTGVALAEVYRLPQ
ncbi:MAG: hypothetical protein M3Y86_04135 [Verrucomicrobiota bacterium]|nr:hypothetical protein [Verrucomicrobiota bacterium]